jgi:hypothetical protein
LLIIIRLLKLSHLMFEFAHQAAKNETRHGT